MIFRILLIVSILSIDYCLYQLDKRHEALDAKVNAISLIIAKQRVRELKREVEKKERIKNDGTDISNSF